MRPAVPGRQVLLVAATALVTTLLVGGTAVVVQQTAGTSGTGVGNSWPIDDNHPTLPTPQAPAVEVLPTPSTSSTPEDGYRHGESYGTGYSERSPAGSDDGRAGQPSPVPTPAGADDHGGGSSGSGGSRGSSMPTATRTATATPTSGHSSGGGGGSTGATPRHQSSRSATSTPSTGDHGHTGAPHP